jgi:predicted transcriptional regulator YdeE
MSTPAHDRSSADETGITEVPGFTVLGFAIRTTNARETSGEEGQIGPLWGRFLQGAGDSIPNVLEPHAIYSVYTNYESDENGPYDLILGKIVDPSQQAPDGMRAVQIPDAKYRLFPARESSPEAIQSAWQSVYQYFAKHPKDQRAYTWDFERHSRHSVAIYIAVR